SSHRRRRRLCHRRRIGARPCPWHRRAIDGRHATMIRTLRISHPAFFGIKSAETLRFYTEVLGMELVLRQPNLDDATMEHLFFHVGEDNFIAYFLPMTKKPPPRSTSA